MERLNWQKLLSDKRERRPQPKSGDSVEVADDSLIARNEFDADYDRIVGSSSVRRLQDKAQVFPLQENDVVRTRLTHSVEVSAMARSFGKAVGNQLLKKELISAEQIDKLASLLQVAGLIHDLGNPPFGHYGETVIRNWFEKYFSTNDMTGPHKAELSEQEKNDFRLFDGNVQNLRIVSKLQTQNDIHGANFTYATLGTIMKYPWASDNRPGSKKKIGYFKSEQKLAKEVREELGLEENVRHPATYLLEAADDIIYLCDDIEDGVKKGCINWEKEYERIKKNLVDTINKTPQLKKLFDDIDNKNKQVDVNMDVQEVIFAKVRNFRNITQTYLFERTVQQFLDKYEDIMSNDFSRVEGLELLQCEKDLIEELKCVTRKNCFSCREVLALELEGHKVITTLLDILVPVFVSSKGKELSDVRTYQGKMFRLLSPNFIYAGIYSSEAAQQEALSEDKDEQLDQMTVYERLHLVTDFISGMTDSYAVNVYQELSGIKHP